MNDINTVKYSAIAPAAEVDEIKLVLARMTAGGFVSTGKGKEARQLNDAERFVLAAVAARYNLDPLMGEIYLLGDKPYVSTDAMLRSAVEQGCHPEYRMATEQERKEHDLDADEVMAVAELYLPGRDRPVKGYGYASPMNTPIAEITRWVNGQKTNVGWDKRILRRMARTRAFRDALRMAYGVAVGDQDDSPRDIGTQTAQSTGAVVSIAAPAVAIQLPQAQVIAPVAAPVVVAEPAPVKVAEPAPVAAPAPKQERAPRKAEPAPEPEPAPAVEPAPEEYQQPRVAEHVLTPSEPDPFGPFRDPSYDCVNAVVRLASEVHAEPGVPSDELDEITDCLGELREAANARMCPIAMAGLRSSRRIGELAGQAGLDIPPTDHAGLMACGLVWYGASVEDAAACAHWLGKAVQKRVVEVFKAKTEDDQRMVLGATLTEWRENEGGAA
jgi:hypothetical protein